MKTKERALRGWTRERPKCSGTYLYADADSGRVTLRNLLFQGKLIITKTTSDDEVVGYRYGKPRLIEFAVVGNDIVYRRVGKLRGLWLGPIKRPRVRP